MALPLVEVQHQTIKHLARRKWQSSGLSDKAAKKLALKGLNADQVQALGAKFHAAGALHIPYFDLRGAQTKFYRLRYLERLPGAAGASEKPQRYDQLPVLQEAYYPPLLDWSAIAKDPTKPIAVTEGELKSGSACAQGVTMMALGGVYSFMAAKRGIDLLPSMKEIIWAERVTVIIYDNDVVTKPEVMEAQNRLAARLTQEGARVYFAAIPEGPAKGVDDLIVAKGVKALKEVLADAVPYQDGAALWALNTEVVYLKKPNIVVERDTCLLMDPDRFQRHQYADRTYSRNIIKGSGKAAHNVLETVHLAANWMEWPHRSKLWDLTYAPGQPRVTANSWNGWEGWGLKPKQGDITPWNNLLDFLFDGDPKTRRYFEMWCAYPIQNPGAKLYTACVLWSRVKRLGKSMLALALARIYGMAPTPENPTYSGPQNAVIVDSRQLKSGFNSWAKNRQLVIGEEITAGEARIDADYLKHVITAPHFRINAKHQPEIDIPNHTNFLFLSNHPDAMFLEDGDQRYLIHGIKHETPGPREMYEQAHKWLWGDGPAYLFDHFLRMRLDTFNPREHAPATASKYQMIMAGKTDTGLWVQRLVEDPVHALAWLGERAATGCDLYTPDLLYRAFDPEGRGRGKASVASLGRQLLSAGFRQLNGGTPIGTNTGVHRIYAVRNAVKWEQSTRKEIRTHYEQFWGPQVQGAIK